jgi:hypothetical protein
MKRLFLCFLTLCFSILMFSGTASAIPVLQLDASNGWYYSGPSGVYDTETIIAPDDAFTLYALLTPNGQNTFNDYDQQYFISMAVWPPTSSVPGFGSFTFNSTTINAGSLTPGRPLNLPSHGVFDTLYYEYGFFFDINDTVGTYNTQDDPGGFGTFPGSDTWYASFGVDTSGIGSDYKIHFDLYSKIYNDKKGVWEIDKFAPFSHDAQSNGSPVPEPPTMLLLGSGLIGLAGFGRKKLFKK